MLDISSGWYIPISLKYFFNGRWGSPGRFLIHSFRIHIPRPKWALTTASSLSSAFPCSWIHKITSRFLFHVLGQFFPNQQQNGHFLFLFKIIWYMFSPLKFWAVPKFNNIVLWYPQQLIAANSRTLKYSPYNRVIFSPCSFNSCYMFSFSSRHFLHFFLRNKNPCFTVLPWEVKPCASWSLTNSYTVPTISSVDGILFDISFLQNAISPQIRHIL